MGFKSTVLPQTGGKYSSSTNSTRMMPAIRSTAADTCGFWSLRYALLGRVIMAQHERGH